jgi:two-component system, cell cycle sensor histidine kinase and response regulator CckA
MSDTISSEPLAKVTGHGETILLVDDEPFVREITGQILVSAGYVVLQASDADQALEAFCKHAGPVHLLVTDMIMPGKTGPELAAELGTLAPDMKTILTSGDAEVTAREFCEHFRIAFLPKPFSVNSLTTKVRSVLSGQNCSGAPCET